MKDEVSRLYPEIRKYHGLSDCAKIESRVKSYGVSAEFAQELLGEINAFRIRMDVAANELERLRADNLSSRMLLAQIKLFMDHADPQYSDLAEYFGGDDLRKENAKLCERGEGT